MADLTALAGKLNEEAANRLIALVEEVLEDIDSASELRESIRAVTEGNLDEQLGSINIGSYSLTHYDRLSILSSFSSGRSLSTLITGSGLGLTAALLAPPIGIAIGLGLGGFYAYQAFRVKGRSLFQTEFKEWMTEQCNQTQVTVTTTFQREIIDLQEEMREVVRGALVDRERQIATSLKESKQLLDAEESKRTAGKQELQGRSNTVRGIQKEISTLLGSLSATAERAGAGGPARVAGRIGRSCPGGAAGFAGRIGRSCPGGPGGIAGRVRRAPAVLAGFAVVRVGRARLGIGPRSGRWARSRASTVGPWVGPDVGPVVGPWVGPVVGPWVGPDVGPVVGPWVGPVVGPVVGPNVGPLVGPAVG